MQSLKLLALASVLTVTSSFASAPQEAEAGYRHYYSSWNYARTYGYHYTRYHYRPVATYTNYHYHYCIRYVARPRYVYFYNPVRRVFWGRFDTQGKPGEQYSLLAPADRKGDINDIAESAFPAPGPMPSIPDSDDGMQIALPTLPTDTPADLPAKE